MNEDVVRVLAPQVPGILVRRGNDFAAAEMPFRTRCWRHIGSGATRLPAI